MTPTPASRSRCAAGRAPAALAATAAAGPCQVAAGASSAWSRWPRATPARNVDVYCCRAIPLRPPCRGLHASTARCSSMRRRPGTTRSGVDETAAALIAAGRVRPFLVGGWNVGAARVSEYFPQKFPGSPHAGTAAAPLPRAPRRGADPAAGALRRRLPEVPGGGTEAADRAPLRRRPARDATVVMGSSMGGLVSIRPGRIPGRVRRRGDACPRTGGRIAARGCGQPGRRRSRPISRHAFHRRRATARISTTAPPRWMRSTPIARGRGCPAARQGLRRRHAAEPSRSPAPSTAEQAWAARLDRPLQVAAAALASSRAAARLAQSTRQLCNATGAAPAGTRESTVHAIAQAGRPAQVREARADRPGCRPELQRTRTQARGGGFARGGGPSADRSHGGARREASSARRRLLRAQPLRPRALETINRSKRYSRLTVY